MVKRLISAGVSVSRPGLSPQNRVPVEKLRGSKFELKAAANEDAADLFIYGDIAWYDITAQMVANALSELKAGTLRVHINSGGGDVFDGIAIYNLLAQRSETIEVHIDGLAASIASVIAMAGDVRIIARNAMMMVHNAWTIALGNADDMRATASLLDAIDGQIVDIYGQHTNQDATALKALMSAETWMDAQACVDKGFATKIADASGAKALVRPGLYDKMPTSLLDTTEDDLRAKEAASAAVSATVAAMQRRVRALEASL